MRKLFFFFFFFFLASNTLNAVATVQGTVRDSATQQPVSGAVVRAYKNNVLRGLGTTNASGFYSFSVVPGRNYVLTASATNFRTQAVGTRLRNNTTTTVNFNLKSTRGTLTGRVTNASNSNPISGATVRVFFGPILISEDTTDANGDYTIPDLKTGIYIVIASASGFRSKAQGAVVIAGKTTTENFALVPNPGAIAGRVTDANTTLPIEGAVVEAFQNSMLVAFDRTDANGDYSLPTLSPGAYLTTAIATDFEKLLVGTFVFEGDTTTTNFPLVTPSGSLTGIVADAISGATLPGVLIEVFSGLTFVTSALTSQEGVYNIDSLAAGSYTVRARTPGYQEEVLGAIITSGETTTVDFALSLSPGSIEGIVTDASTSLPLSGALIEVFRGPILIGSALSNSSGNYMVETLTPGSYTVQASAAEFQRSSQEVDVISDIALEVNFALASEPGEIACNVTDDVTALPIPGALVEAFDGLSPIASGVTDENGDVTLTSIAPGEFEVGASASEYQKQILDVTVTSGNTSNASFTLATGPATIQGAVTSSEGALSAVLIQIIDGTTLVSFTLTDIEGNYNVGSLAAGNYIVRASLDNFVTQEIGIALAEGETETVNFLLIRAVEPPLSITGKAFDDRYLVVTDRIHRIQWQASSTLEVVEYRIFRNGLLIQTVGASSPLIYDDHNRNGQTDVYSVEAVNAQGERSARVSITLS